MNPYVLLAAGVALVLLCAGSAKLGYDHALGQAAREEVLIEKAGKELSTVAAKAIAGIDVKVYPIRERLEREITKLPPSPEECNATQPVLDAINDARRAP
jgi:hypothetical protein